MKNEFLDPSPLSFFQIRGVPALDPSPSAPELHRAVMTYLLASKVEGKSPLTLESYGRKLIAFVRFVGNIPAAGITNNHIRSFMLQLQEHKLNGSTQHSYYRSLKTFFNWMVAEGTLERTPFINIKPPKIPKTLPQPFSTRDLEKILLCCQGKTFLDRRNMAIILIFLDTGIRLAEMANVRLKDVSFDNETIIIMGKGAKQRMVRIGYRTQQALMEYLMLRNDELPCLWVTEERKPMHRDGIRIMIKRLCILLEITDAKPGPHTFRHTFATRAILQHAGEFEVQSLLGHSTLTMTRRYVSTVGSEAAVLAHKNFSPVDHFYRKK